MCMWTIFRTNIFTLNLIPDFVCSHAVKIKNYGRFGCVLLRCYTWLNAWIIKLFVIHWIVYSANKSQQFRPSTENGIKSGFTDEAFKCDSIKFLSIKIFFTFFIIGYCRLNPIP